MGRYDKYNPKNGGYRAPLAADWLSANVEKVLGVGHNAAGAVVVGAGTSGITGVLVLTMARKAGEIIDVMTSGEIVEFGPSDASSVPGTDFGDPGTVYYSDADGIVTTEGAPGSVRVGHTVEGQRLIVRVEQSAVPAAVDFAAAPAGSIPITAIEATGTPSASNYLKGDASWGTV